jgi:hypothetical protein
MLKYIKYVTLISLLLLSFLSQGQSNNKKKIAPFFLLPDEKGTMISLNNFTGKVVYLTFWAPNCQGTYFNKEISQLQHRLKNYDNIVFVHIALDVDHNQWVKTDKPEGINLLNNSSQIDILYGVDEYPYGIVIGKDSRILGNNIDCDAITDYILICALDGIKSKTAYWKLLLNSPDKKTGLYLQEKMKYQQDSTYCFQKF